MSLRHRLCSHYSRETKHDEKYGSKRKSFQSDAEKTEQDTF